MMSRVWKVLWIWSWISAKCRARIAASSAVWRAEGSWDRY